MATSTRAQENSVVNLHKKPSAIVKPLPASCTTTSARPPLTGVANQQGAAARGRNEGERGARQSRVTRATTSRAGQVRSESTQAGAAVQQQRREEEEEEQQRQRGAREGRTTRTTTAAARVPKTTTTRPAPPSQVQSTLEHTEQDGAPNQLKRSVSTRASSRQTAAAAGPKAKKSQPAESGAVAVSRPRRVAGLAAEDGDIRRTDGRYVNTRSRRATTTSVTTSGLNSHQAVAGRPAPKPRKTVAALPTTTAESSHPQATASSESGQPQAAKRAPSSDPTTTTSSSLELMPFIPKAPIDYSEDPSMCGEYATDIYIYHRQLEEESYYLVCTRFMEHQCYITSSHRRVVVDWLAQIHIKYRLLQETMILTVDILDRYLQISVVSKHKLQLVGLASLLISSKFEEVYAPSVRELEHIAANTYSRDEILAMEKTILHQLDYRFLKPYPIHFLRRFSRLSLTDTNVHHLAKYFIDLSLLETEGSSLLPSKKAAAAFIIANANLYGSPARKAWTAELTLHTGYSVNHLADAVKILLVVVHKKHQADKATAIRDKYVKSAPTDRLKALLRTGLYLDKIKV